MEIGKLRHRIELYSVTETQDNYGEVTKGYELATTVWASIKPLSGKELAHAQQVSAETSFKIVIRYNSAVTSEYRLVFGSRTFEITGMLNGDEKGEYLVLMCSEIS